MLVRIAEQENENNMKKVEGIGNKGKIFTSLRNNFNHIGKTAKAGKQ